MDVGLRVGATTGSPHGDCSNQLAWRGMADWLTGPGTLRQYMRVFNSLPDCCTRQRIKPGRMARAGHRYLARTHLGFATTVLSILNLTYPDLSLLSISLCILPMIKFWICMVIIPGRIHIYPWYPFASFVLSICFIRAVYDSLSMSIPLYPCRSIHVYPFGSSESMILHSGCPGPCPSLCITYFPCLSILLTIILYSGLSFCIQFFYPRLYILFSHVHPFISMMHILHKCGKTWGLSFISNRQLRKEGTFCASELAGIDPMPPSPEEQGMPAFAN